MKENNKQVVFYSAEKDGFLESYKDKGSLAFTAVFTDRLEKALFLPLESYEDQTQKGELEPKKVEGQKTALKSLVTVLNNLVAQLH